MTKKKVKTLSTFEKRKTRWPITLQKICDMTQTTWYHSNKHMQIKITHVMKNHSQYELNKYSGVPWKQHCLSKLTLSSEKPQALLLSLKAQKTQDDSWFHCKVVQKMPLSTLPGTVDNIWRVYRGQDDKGGVLSKHHYKETRILLINTIAFS